MSTTIPTRREPVDLDELRLLRERGTVVLDEQRRRPRYFDGRFLAARDLTREQTYFLSRQATLGQVLGSGIVAGLQVERGAAAGTVRISAGHGLTPAGELVAVDADLEVRLADVTESERLDAAFGLRRRPQPPARSRSGLYVLGLRPVEFTANPIAAYPTSLEGPRSLQDGEIVEATAVTLVPYPEEAVGEVGMRRARVARDIFVEGSARGIPTQVLPLALLALERGSVLWADAFLVRRELGSHHGDLPGLGLSPRALREAHLMQYELHLRDVEEERRRRGLPDRFAATEHFLALPPAGRLPRGAVDATAFTQTFFPPEVDVDLALVPEDEVPALLRDSLLLPPIDLTLGPEGLAATPVLALVPVGRDSLRAMASLTRPARSVLPGRIALQRPIALLKEMKLARLAPLVRPLPADPVDAAWRTALAGAEHLWFVRRRNLSERLERRSSNVVLEPERGRPIFDSLGRIAPVVPALPEPVRPAEPKSEAPPRSEPPKVEPPKVEPPKREPPKREPPKSERPNLEPPRREPPKTEPPKIEPEIRPTVVRPKMSPKKPKGRRP